MALPGIEESNYLGQAEVDDVLDVGDGDRGLGHVRRQDHLTVALTRRLEDEAAKEQGSSTSTVNVLY